MTERRMVGSLRMVVILVLVAAFGATVPRASEAAGPMGRGGWGGGDFGGPLLPFMLHAANLTADQKTQVQQIVSSHRPTMRGVVQQLRQTQQQLADRLVAPGTLQPADLQDLTQQIAQLRGQLLQESTQVALEVRAVLTPDQLTRVAQTRAQMRQLREQMRQLWQSSSQP